VRALPATLGRSTTLVRIIVVECAQLASLHADLFLAPHLEEVVVQACSLVTLPSRVRRAPTLRRLAVVDMPSFAYLPPRVPLALEELRIFSTSVAVVPPGIVLRARSLIVHAADTPIVNGSTRNIDELGVVQSVWHNYSRAQLRALVERLGDTTDSDGELAIFAESRVERLRQQFERFVAYNRLDGATDDYFDADIALLVTEHVEGRQEDAAMLGADGHDEDEIERLVDSMNNARGLPPVNSVQDLDLREEYRAALEALETCPELLGRVDVTYRRGQLTTFYSERLIRNYIFQAQRLAYLACGVASSVRATARVVVGGDEQRSRLDHADVFDVRFRAP